MQYVEATILSLDSIETAKPIPTIYGEVRPTVYESGFTGIPEITSNDVVLSNVFLAESLTNTVELLSDTSDPTFEPDSLPVIDDWVTLGVSIGKTEIGDNFEDFLTNIAVLKIRADMNENNEEIQAALDQLMRDLRADIGSREMGRRMRPTTPRFRSFAGHRRWTR
jgi:hypothetical protein